MKTSFIKFGLVISAVISTVSFAQNNEQQPSTPVVEVVDSVTGVTYEVNENGEFARIRSVGEAELEIGDRKDIRVATQKAILRAKASIAKFLNERVTSDEVMDNVEKTVTNTTNGAKSVTRDTISNYTETIHNSAEALLKGVIALKTDVNKDEKYVQVEVGISDKTLNVADKLGQALQRSNTNNPNAIGTSNAIPVGGEGGREIKKAKNYDNF